MENAVTVENIYAKVKEVLDTARSTVYKAVNFAMVQAYWNIGMIIVEEEQKGKKRAEYGKYIINELSKRLTQDFGKGFDKRNLWYMRNFYQLFPILNAVRSELTWTHYRLLLKVENKPAREFYVNECIENNWSTRSLERQINSFYYERLISSQEKLPVKKEAISNTTRQSVADFIKDPYILEFLDLKENKKYLEHELEKALIDKLQDFLLELGKGFCFVARQKRITIDGDHFYIDLVFYNYILKCFVLIDLKTGKLNHQDIGQMDFYVRYFEKELKPEGDNPTIGMLLCSDKNDSMIKYTLLEESKQIFASKYMLYLPTEEELKNELSKERKLLEMENEFLKGQEKNNGQDI